VSVLPVYHAIVDAVFTRTLPVVCRCACCLWWAKEEVAYYLSTLVGVLELIVMLCDRDPLQRGSLAHGFVAQ
jgi:hypothetical protein